MCGMGSSCLPRAHRMGLAMLLICLAGGALLPAGKVLAQSPTPSPDAKISTPETKPDAAEKWRLWDQLRGVQDQLEQRLREYGRVEDAANDEGKKLQDFYRPRIDRLYNIKQWSDDDVKEFDRLVDEETEKGENALKKLGSDTINFIRDNVFLKSKQLQIISGLAGLGSLQQAQPLKLNPDDKTIVNECLLRKVFEGRSPETLGLTRLGLPDPLGLTRLSDLPRPVCKWTDDGDQLLGWLETSNGQFVFRNRDGRQDLQCPYLQSQDLLRFEPTLIEPPINLQRDEDAIRDYSNIYALTEQEVINVFDWYLIAFRVKPARGLEKRPGLGARKQEILKKGGTVLDLAVVMLENRDMRADYPLGDIYPDKRPKTEDAANFGIFRQNWLMIRSSWGPYRADALGPGDYLKGKDINNDLSLDIQILHASQNHYGLDTWFAGHRNGVSGLKCPDTLDVRVYRDAVYWIRNQIKANPSYLTDDTHLWVVVPPI